MSTVRIPLAQPIESRSATVIVNYPAKDSFSQNCYFETRNGVKEIIKRPGTAIYTVSPALASGQACGLFTFNGTPYNGNLFAAIDRTIYTVSSTGISGIIGTMTGPIATCSFNQTATVPYLVVQNQTHLYTWPTGGILQPALQLDTILNGLSLSTSGLAYGVVYLDGYTFVMTTTGRIYNSAIEDPNTWNSLDFITAESEPDGGIGIVKHFNYLVAFGAWSTEFFYDNQNPTGSPLARNDAARLEIGCSNGGSIARIEQSLLWVGKSKTHGKSVYLMDGLSPVKVSTPAIERYLNADTTDSVRACAFKIEGHTFYVMTLHSSEITFVYDIDEKEWYNWTFWGVGVGYTYFRPTFYSEFNSGHYVIDDDTGVLYNLSPTIYNDYGNHITFQSITPIIDSGTTKRKFYRRLEIVGDKISATMVIRHSDDDYTTWSAYRSIDLSTGRPQIYQLGSARRRAWQFSCTDDVPLRITAAEIDFDIGELESEPGQQVNRR